MQCLWLLHHPYQPHLRNSKKNTEFEPPTLTLPEYFELCYQALSSVIKRYQGPLITPFSSKSVRERQMLSTLSIDFESFGLGRKKGAFVERVRTSLEQVFEQVFFQCLVTKAFVEQVEQVEQHFLQLPLRGGEHDIFPLVLGRCSCRI